MKELLEMIEAYNQGKTIQRRNVVTNEWHEFDLGRISMKLFYSNADQFRIAPNQFKMVARGYRKFGSFYVVLSENDLEKMSESKKYKVTIEEIE